eukprot:Lithocolla_globosa_v1_NODE_618_length_3583_cov_3.898810.p2 type:complete len:433 gc:universal NODE_618_length_3583_cov_3.898810:1533-2831(+)
MGSLRRFLSTCRPKPCFASWAFSTQYWLKLRFPHNGGRVVTLILKPGREPSMLSSYRPITVVNAVCKLLELVFLARFESAVGVGHDEQMGGERGRGCPEQILCLLEAISRGQSSGPVVAVFLDIVRAYDTVKHVSLFAALWRDGIRGRTWLLFRNWYANLCTQVRLRGQETTDFFRQLCGTRQGSVLSPLFFVLFMNELVTMVKDEGVGLDIDGELLSSLLIMDDVVLLTNNCDDMRKLLGVVSDFAAKWHVRFHVADDGGDVKTAALFFTGSHPPSPPAPPLQLCGDEVAVRTSYKYAGYWLSTDHAQAGRLAVAKRCAAATHAADEAIASLACGSSCAERLEDYRCRVQSVLRYPLAVLDLTWHQKMWLDRTEETLLRRMGCLPQRGESLRTLAGWVPVSQVLAGDRAKLLSRMRSAPPTSWRSRLCPEK